MSGRKIASWAAVLALALASALSIAAQEDPGLPPLDDARIVTAPAQDRLGQIETYLNSLDAVAASFIQQAPDGSVASGTLSLERPGRLRFDYGEDLPILLVSDGTTLTFVDYDISQVTRWPVKDTPLGLLVGRDIDLSAPDLSVKVLPGPLPHLTVLQASNPEREEFGIIELTFAHRGPDDIRLLGWEAIDAQGFVTRIALNDIQIGQDLPDSLWQFKDPRNLPAQRRRRGR